MAVGLRLRRGGLRTLRSIRMRLGWCDKAAGQRDRIDKIELRRRANGYCTGGRSGLRCALTQMRNIHKAGASNTRRQSLHGLLAQSIKPHRGTGGVCCKGLRRIRTICRTRQLWLISGQRCKGFVGHAIARLRLRQR